MYELFSEHGNPPLRRKSCDACKKAKRRCDLAFPACLRCARRNIPCIYPGRQPLESSGNLLDVVLPEARSGNTWPALNNDPDIINEIDLLSPSNAGPCPFDTAYFQSNLANTTSPVPLIEQPHNSFVSHGFEVVKSKRIPSKPLSDAIAAKLQFAIDILKETPRMIVTEGKTPWCHRQLYKDGMPKVFQDCYACCSLYMSKNQVNTPVILSILESRIHDLQSTPILTSAAELLARTQSLIFYQIMHMFDSDIRSHAATEKVLPMLESAVLSLLGYLYLPDPASPADLLPSSMESIMDFWGSWVSQESARRTVLLGLYSIQIYKLLQGTASMYCDGRLGLVHAWYSSAHLWNAETAFDFAVAWTERQHFVISNADFSDVLQNAHADDVDLFTKMLLVTILGIDKAKAWFYARGALL